MAAEITLTQYDPKTKRYVAQLTITEGEATYAYSCQGTWHAEDAEMVAGSLYDQHKEALAKESTVEVEKQAICSAILTEVGKKAAVAAAEVK